DGKGKVLDQFGNMDNPEAHYQGTGPEIWRDTQGQVTHFVSSMGTTGTIMGVSRYLKEQNPDIQIVGLQPTEGAAIPGIRRWPQEYLPSIFDRSRVDLVVDMSQQEAEDTMRRLAREEGIFCGVSSGGAVAAARRLNAELGNAVIAVSIGDRGDRYLAAGGGAGRGGSGGGAAADGRVVLRQRQASASSFPWSVFPMTAAVSAAGRGAPCSSRAGCPANRWSRGWYGRAAS